MNEITSLTKIAHQARDKALKRLLELKSAHNRWDDFCDLSAFCNILHTFMVRTTGLIEQPESLPTEAKLIEYAARRRLGRIGT